MGLSFSILKEQEEVLSWWKRHELMDSFVESYKSIGVEIENIANHDLTIELLENAKKHFIECYIEKTRPIVEHWGTTRHYYDNDEEHLKSLNSQVKQLETLIKTMQGKEGLLFSDSPKFYFYANW